MSEQLQWDSNLSFILAMIGAAVGLGNIWRFSYVLYSNGGGSFFIPYLIAILIMGIPFLILEYGLGFTFRDSFSNLLKSINERFEYIGWILVLLVFLIVCYYVVIVAWDLVYLFSSLSFSWGADPTSYFVNFVGGSSDMSNATTLIIPTFLSVIAIWLIVWYVSHKNLEKGIGMVSKILIPALFTFMLIIIIYSLTLPGHMIGIDNLLRPNWSTLWDINIWIGAFAQILFSLSMGQAIAYTYASYLPEDSRFTNDIFLVVTANSLFEIFTAFGIFSVLGYMSLHSGLRLSSLISEGTGLVFEVFPTIFNIMGPFARILAPLLFLSIFFAGITSALGIFEPMLSSTMHKFNLSRRKATTILATIGCLISITFTTGISSYLVGIVDMFINQFGVLFLIGLQCVIFTWFYKVEDLIPVINEHGFINVSKKWIVIIKYILPILIFGMWIYGLLDLFNQANGFELFVDMTIVIVVLVSGFILTRFKPKGIES